VVLTILSGLDKPASYVVRWLVMINNSDLLSLSIQRDHYAKEKKDEIQAVL
jgi:hypothetical protein